MKREDYIEFLGAFLGAGFMLYLAWVLINFIYEGFYGI
jgi:hypothetical protein